MIVSIVKTGLVINNFIAIDQFDTNPDVKYCFLSSAHPHHLNSKWQNGGIYCSPITAQVLSVINSQRKGFRISDKWIRPLNLNLWHEMDGFRVMLIDANHAPGAVMLIIEGEYCNPLGRILYTGFFRADAKFYENVMGLSALQEKKFDVVCIDSTYIKFVEEEFPTRQSSAKEAVNLLRILRYNGVDNVAIPVPIIRRESFLVSISQELKCKIWLHPERFKMACVLGIKDYFVDTKDDTYIWTCSQWESQQVISTTNSHIIKTSMASSVKSNILLNEREHVIRYSDHCSLAELRLFLSSLSFCRVIGIPNKLSCLVEDKLQSLSLPGTQSVYHSKGKHRYPEKLLFDPFRFSCWASLVFDYVFRNFFNQFSAVENDENMSEVLQEESYIDDFINEQQLKISNSGMLIKVSDARYLSFKNYPFQKFHTNFISDILYGDDENNADKVEGKLDKIAIFDAEYMGCGLQRMENFSQDTCERESNVANATVVVGILEKQCNISFLLDYLISTFCLNGADYGSADMGFLSYMDISGIFNDFDGFLEEYRKKSMKELSVGIMNQSYHVEKNIYYDSSNAPILPDVAYELLYCNPILNSQKYFCD